MKERINTITVTKWTILGFLLFFMIITDAWMTDQALEKGGFYETNPFTNKFGTMAHAVILTSVTALLTMRSNKKCLMSRFLLSIGLLVWTLNNIYSLTLVI